MNPAEKFATRYASRHDRTADPDLVPATLDGGIGVGRHFPAQEVRAELRRLPDPKNRTATVIATVVNRQIPIPELGVDAS